MVLHISVLTYIMDNEGGIYIYMGALIGGIFLLMLCAFLENLSDSLK